TRRSALPPVILSKIVPPPRSKWTLRSRMERSGSGDFIENVLRKMAQRLVARRDLDKGRELTSANILRKFASWSERTTWWKMCRIGWESRNLVKLSFRSGIGNGSEQSFRVRISRPAEQFRRHGMLENLACIHDADVARHARDHTKL